ncbi:MAG TPA: energy-coupled thiamine transporter ThiT [Selenomonadales bacterium]|nr:energy-coupled thiamine transporter ThiT [Selenomonadales bacterium]
MINLEKTWAVLLENPMAGAALIGVLLILFLLLHLRKIKLDTRLITQIGMVLALATLIKVFRIYHLPQGGSITLGSMVPILLMAVTYGPEIGFLTGFLFGVITLVLDPYVLHPVQVLFDYPLPFMALGLAGYFRRRVLVGTAVAIAGRFVCHFISGVAFFGSYAPKGMSPALYSLVVNGIFLGVEGVICLVIMGLLPLGQLKFFLTRKPVNAE